MTLGWPRGAVLATRLRLALRSAHLGTASGKPSAFRTTATRRSARSAIDTSDVRKPDNARALALRESAASVSVRFSDTERERPPRTTPLGVAVLSVRLPDIDHCRTGACASVRFSDNARASCASVRFSDNARCQRAARLSADREASRPDVLPGGASVSNPCSLPAAADGLWFDRVGGDTS